MKKFIHVNQHKIKSNKKLLSDAKEPVIGVETYKGKEYGNEIHISGPCRVVYRPDNPLGCGAHVWIETESEVEIC